MKRSKRYLAALICAGIYLAGYFVVIDPNIPAVDSENRIVFQSCYRFGPVTTRVIEGTTVSFIKVSWVNYFYLPVDYIYHKLHTHAYRNGFEKYFHKRDWFMMN